MGSPSVPDPETEDRTRIIPKTRCWGSLGRWAMLKPCAPTGQGPPKSWCQQNPQPGRVSLHCGGSGDRAPAREQPVHGSAPPPTPHFTTFLLNNSLWSVCRAAVPGHPPEGWGGSGDTEMDPGTGRGHQPPPCAAEETEARCPGTWEQPGQSPAGTHRQRTGIHSCAQPQVVPAPRGPQGSPSCPLAPGNCSGEGTSSVTRSSPGEPR